MNEQELISKIQLLKEIKPSEDWVLSCRAKLAFRLEMDRKKSLLNKDVFVLRELFAFWGKSEAQLSFNWAHSMAVAVMVVLGGGILTTWAAGQSLPGSPLYPVKLTIERARVSASFSDESRLKLQAELADARLQELTDVVKSNDSDDQKVAKMSQVAKSIQDQLSTVNKQSPKAGAKIEPQKVLAAAKMVSDKASEAGKTLAAAKESISGDIKPDLSAKLADATQAVEEAGITALETMVANQDASNVKNEDIAIKLSEAIKKIEESIQAKEQKITQTNSLVDKSPIRAVLINQFEQSLDLLDKARGNLFRNDFKGSLDMLKAAMAIDDGTNKMTQDTVKPEVKGAASSTVMDLAK